ncbi:hypothetical protein ACIQUS_15520 [Pseudomonas sp. NPDC090755]|uniref:hypothetical protein n=1 Tax=Pseudomonas sp. NPDC090755 TaxID=3364481 RepID=UPI00383A7C78
MHRPLWELAKPAIDCKAAATQAAKHPADHIALALTLFAATRLPILPVVLIAVLATGTLRWLSAS